jgi:hypothetical protein
MDSAGHGIDIVSERAQRILDGNYVDTPGLQ